MDNHKTCIKEDALIRVIRESSIETYRVSYLPHMLPRRGNSIYEISYRRINRENDYRYGSITTTLLLNFNNGSEAQISRDTCNRRSYKAKVLRYRNKRGGYLKNPKARLKRIFESMNPKEKQSILEQIPQKVRSLLERVL